MKKYLQIGIVLLLAGCTNQVEVNRVSRESDSLIGLVVQRDLLLKDFAASFGVVERNLDAIAKKQNILVVNAGSSGELIPGEKDKINSEINAINKLMDENRKLITDLGSKYLKSNDRGAQFKEMIETLNEQVTHKEKELSVLNAKLFALNKQVTRLETSVDTLAQTVSEQTAELHTAYYVIGKTKDLEEAKISDRSGGLLGIGRTTRLNNNFDAVNFTRVDFTQMGAIPIDSKNVKIITTHPLNSYNLDKDRKNIVKSLVITDPEKFWSASKYLVVVKE